MEVIISNQKRLKELKDKIKKAGYKRLYVLSDFDRTLTYGTINGIKAPSIVSMLRDGKHLKKDYADKAKFLFQKYHSFEIDPEISLEEKRKLMHEWWVTHNNLLIDSGLNKKDLKDIVENGLIRFRKGISDFLDFLHKHNIPLIIVSASGCGDAIRLFFQKIKKDYKNIFYITNHFYWDKNGKAIAVKKPIIHSLNKDEITLQDIPEIYNVIRNRKNIILLGDQIEDIEIIKNLDYENFLKIGFLNYNYDNLKKVYKKNFDIILKSDEDISFVSNLIKRIFRIF
ncbi:MAG: hypothetical protein PHN37_02730 [Candidatus Pacebacteria bacterium]|nr:hypothetical protein [Candidatus Paceibacterota bacterium]